MIIENCFPGFVKRAVTFSIDDGNVQNDAKFIDIVKPRGLKGAFNIISSSLKSLTPDGYRDFYRGFEIANHCKFHPVTIDPNDPREFCDKAFDRATADERFYYRHPEIDGLWYLKRHDFWCVGAGYEDYIRFADLGRAECEAVFGKGSVKGFVWPHGCCYDDRILEHMRSEGYVYTRYTMRHDSDFSMPSDRMRIGLNARCKNLADAVSDFLSTPLDTLKLLIIGTHSSDYERDGKWGELASAVDRLGISDGTAWSAAPSDIFAYEDALKSLEKLDGGIKNPSDLTVYLKIDGECVKIAPNEKITV